MNPQELFNKLEQCIAALGRGNTQLKQLALKKSDTQNKYMVALRKEMLKLQLEGYKATLINDLARGEETYENWVRVCFQNQSGAYLEGPIRARIIAYYKVPASYSKKRLQSIRDGLGYPCKAPDIDNCIKIILDSLNCIAYSDDK